jgi:hypothetical protein
VSVACRQTDFQPARLPASVRPCGGGRDFLRQGTRHFGVEIRQHEQLLAQRRVAPQGLLERAHVVRVQLR